MRLHRQGKAQGVEAKDRARSPGGGNEKRILKGEGSRGQETGVQKENGGKKLSPQQVHVIKASSMESKNQSGGQSR